MAQLNWKGRPYRPVGGTGFIKVYKPDINELIKPLSQKKGLGSAILTGQAINPVNKPSTSPVPPPSPSVTPSVTPSLTPTLTQTMTPSVTPTEPYDIYLLEECGNPSNKFRFENVPGILVEGNVYFISGGTSIWNTETEQWENNTENWEGIFNGYATVIPYSATGVVYSSVGITFTQQPSCPGVTPSPTPSMTATVTPTPSSTPTMTPTPSLTPTMTQTNTPSLTPSITPTKTVTPSITPSTSPLTCKSYTVNGGTAGSTFYIQGYQLPFPTQSCGKYNQNEYVGVLSNRTFCAKNVTLISGNGTIKINGPC